MAFIPVPNVARADVIGSLFGQVVENTLYFLSPEPLIGSVVAQLAGSVAEWAVTRIVEELGDDYTYLRTETQDLSEAGLPIYTDATAVGTPGGDPSGCVPGNVTFAVSFRSGLGGRSFRGRNYVPGVPNQYIVGNQVNSGFVDEIVARYNLLPADVHDDLPELDWCVVSRYHLGAPRAEGVATPITTCVSVDYNIDSQRRRLTGRGT